MNDPGVRICVIVEKFGCVCTNFEVLKPDEGICRCVLCKRVYRLFIKVRLLEEGDDLYAAAQQEKLFNTVVPSGYPCQ